MWSSSRSFFFSSFRNSWREEAPPLWETRHSLCLEVWPTRITNEGSLSVPISKVSDFHIKGGRNTHSNLQNWPLRCGALRFHPSGAGVRNSFPAPDAMSPFVWLLPAPSLEPPPSIFLPPAHPLGWGSAAGTRRLRKEPLSLWRRGSLFLES